MGFQISCLTCIVFEPMTSRFNNIRQLKGENRLVRGWGEQIAVERIEKKFTAKNEMKIKSRLSSVNADKIPRQHEIAFPFLTAALASWVEIK